LLNGGAMSGRSSPTSLVAVGVLAGALAAPACATPTPCLAFAAVAALVLALAARRTAAAALLLAGTCLGLAFAARVEPPLPGLPDRVRGTVVGSALGAEADVLVNATAQDGNPWTPASGRLRVRFPDGVPRPGTPFVAGGKSHRFPRYAPPGEPTRRWALARAHVQAILVAKDVVVEGVDPGPSPAARLVHGDLVAAMAGRPAEVPAAEKQLLQRTGTWHLVAVSGMQVALAAAAAWWACRLVTAPMAWLRRRGGAGWLCAAGAVAAAVAFTCSAGSPPSAVRATVIVAIGAATRAAGARAGAWEALALALCATLLLDPTAVDNLGFQLSFAAVAGIIAWSSRVTRWVPLDAPRALRALAAGLGGTLGATLGTLPVVALHFQSLSPLAALTNLLVGPLLGGCATPCAVVGFALAGAWPRLGDLLLTVADTATDLALQTLQPLDVEPWHPAVGAGGALLLVIAALNPRRPLVVAALVVAALGLRWPFPPADGRLVVQFLAIGQGDAALISFPDGRVWAVDTGPSPTAMLDVLRRQGVLRLDRVVLSHPHPDHYGGLEALLQELHVGELHVPRAARPGGGESEVAFARLLALAPVVRTAALDAPAVLLHPLAGWTSAARDPVNDESLVLRLDFGARRFLFTGDIERDGEAELLANHAADLRADVLKVAHHGSRTSSSWPFVTAVNPAIAVISCGEENRFHHPNPETLAHLRGRRVYRTDRDGTVIVSTDGHDLHVDLPDAGAAPIDVATGAPRPPRASAADRLTEILLDP